MSVTSPHTPIPALTFRQPWAELLISGRKTIEIRTWADSYRGPIWIHAGKTPIEGTHPFGDLPLGAFVGIAELNLILPLDPERWEAWRDLHLNDGPYPGHTFAWVFARPERFEKPVAGRGMPGLFFPPEDKARELEAATGQAR